MSSINAYVSRKNRGALPAPAEFVFQLLRVDRPILQGAEGFLDAGPVDLDDGFVAGLQLKFLDDLARDDDPEGRAPPPDPGPATGHDYYMLDDAYNTSRRVFGGVICIIYHIVIMSRSRARVRRWGMITIC